MQDIQFWEGELTNETDKLLHEMEFLQKGKKALETFLKETDNQLHIAQESLYNREKRQGW